MRKILTAVLGFGLLFMLLCVGASRQKKATTKAAKDEIGRWENEGGNFDAR